MELEVVMLAIDRVFRRAVEVTNSQDTVLLDHVILIDDNFGRVVGSRRELSWEEDLPVPGRNVTMFATVCSLGIVFESVRDHGRIHFHVLGNVIK